MQMTMKKNSKPRKSPISKLGKNLWAQLDQEILCDNCQKPLVVTEVEINTGLFPMHGSLSGHVLCPPHKDIEVTLNCPFCPIIEKGIALDLEYKLQGSHTKIILKDVKITSIAFDASYPSTGKITRIKEESLNPSRRDNNW